MRTRMCTAAELPASKAPAAGRARERRSVAGRGSRADIEPGLDTGARTGRFLARAPGTTRSWSPS